MRLPTALANLLPPSLSLTLIGALVTGSFGSSVPTPWESHSSPVFVGAGDIASCYDDNDEATARLLDEIDGTVFTLGDNTYDHGTSTEFASCYAPTWGRHLARTRPSPGNHDYATPEASAYFAYFGERAGDPTQGYYSYDLGEWHIIALNTNCAEVGGCGEGSNQLAWLRADLAAHPARCTLAYGHHPRFSSGGHDDANLTPMWKVLHDGGIDVVLSGHDHTYERFAPQDAAGALDTVSGIRQFVVGTGGARHYDFEALRPNSEIRNSDTFGVLMLTLQPTRYVWTFVPIAGAEFSDHGSTACH